VRSREMHPDVVAPGGTEAEVERAEANIRALNEAYEAVRTLL